MGENDPAILPEAHAGQRVPQRHPDSLRETSDLSSSRRRRARMPHAAVGGQVLRVQAHQQAALSAGPVRGRDSPELSVQPLRSGAAARRAGEGASGWPQPVDSIKRLNPVEKTETGLIPVEVIERRIYLIRGEKVMLDSDLAELYRVETKNLNKAVKRNLDRSPPDFMFQLTKQEATALRFQIGTSRWGGRRYLPYAFTEQGVAMLSSVLNSERAVQMNILIIRVFVRLREILATHKDLARKLEELERRQERQAADIRRRI